MIAISVKYIGPGNVRGSRYKATSDLGSVTIGADSALNATENAFAAARALAAKHDLTLSEEGDHGEFRKARIWFATYRTFRMGGS